MQFFEEWPEVPPNLERPRADHLEERNASFNGLMSGTRVFDRLDFKFTDADFKHAGKWMELLSGKARTQRDSAPLRGRSGSQPDYV